MAVVPLKREPARLASLPLPLSAVLHHHAQDLCRPCGVDGDGLELGILCDETYALSERSQEKGEAWLRKEIIRARQKWTPRSPPIMLQGREVSPIRFREVLA